MLLSSSFACLLTPSLLLAIAQQVCTLFLQTRREIRSHVIKKLVGSGWRYSFGLCYSGIDLRFNPRHELPILFFTQNISLQQKEPETGQRIFCPPCFNFSG